MLPGLKGSHGFGSAAAAHVFVGLEVAADCGALRGFENHTTSVSRQLKAPDSGGLAVRHTGNCR